MPRWTFVRHAESVANAEGWLAGHTDAPLTERGREQAKSLRDALAGVPFERVLTSDLSRAVETVELALPNRAFLSIPGLRERSLGVLEGTQRTGLTEDERFRMLLDPDGHPPQGESHTQLVQRVLAALVDHDGTDDTLVVAHGGVLRAVLTLVDELDAEEALRLRLPNVCIQTRELPVGSWRMVAEAPSYL